MKYAKAGISGKGTSLHRHGHMVDFLRKKGQGFRLLVKAINESDPCITAITAFELYLGHTKMKRKDSMEIEGFISQFNILPFDFPARRRQQKYRQIWMKRVWALVYLMPSLRPSVLQRIFLCLP